MSAENVTNRAWPEFPNGIFRAAHSTVEAGVMATIDAHSRGARNPTEFTPIFLVEDFAKEMDFSEEQCGQALKDLIDRGLVTLVSGYRYRLDYAKIGEIAFGAGGAQ